jgi:hypothetical protein
MSSRKSKKIKKVGTEWNTLFLLYADDVNVLTENINTLKKKMVTLSECSMEVGLN